MGSPNCYSWRRKRKKKREEEERGVKLAEEAGGREGCNSSRQTRGWDVMQEGDFPRTQKRE